MGDTADTPTEPVGPSTFAHRLRASADEVEELEELLRIARERRNALIVAAVDEHGMTHDQAGRHARLSRSRVIALLSAA